jgi:hypothetical protein
MRPACSARRDKSSLFRRDESLDHGAIMIAAQRLDTNPIMADIVPGDLEREASRRAALGAIRENNDQPCSRCLAGFRLRNHHSERRHPGSHRPRRAYGIVQ